VADKQADVTSLQPDEHPLRHNGFRLLVLTGELRGREIDVLSGSRWESRAAATWCCPTNR
jgi:hypothetical protein